MTDEAPDRSFVATVSRAWRQFLTSLRATAQPPSAPAEKSLGPAEGRSEERSEIERLRQELERCQAERAKLASLYDEIASRYAALNFKAYKLSEDNFTWEVNASGLRASEAYLYRERDQLRVEIDILRRVVACCDSQTDLCRQFREEILRQAAEQKSRAEQTADEPAAGAAAVDGAQPAGDAAGSGEP